MSISSHGLYNRSINKFISVIKNSTYSHLSNTTSSKSQQLLFSLQQNRSIDIASFMFFLSLPVPECPFPSKQFSCWSFDFYCCRINVIWSLHIWEILFIFSTASPDCGQEDVAGSASHKLIRHLNTMLLSRKKEREWISSPWREGNV